MAIKGERFDGHSFVKEALSKGASAVVISQNINAYGLTGTVISVPNTGRVLHILASNYFKNHQKI